MENENYCTIQGWLINVLGLKGNELILFAIIYGFSQDGKSKYYGSLSYIQKSLLEDIEERMRIAKAISRNALKEIGLKFYTYNENSEEFILQLSD